MTPKEKSIELLNKFFNYCSYEWYEGEEGHKENMKQCALIAVDEILSELAYTQNYVQDNMNKIAIYISYWQQVKQEIEKL